MIDNKTNSETNSLTKYFFIIFFLIQIATAVIENIRTVSSLTKESVFIQKFEDVVSYTHK